MAEQKKYPTAVKANPAREIVLIGALIVGLLVAGVVAGRLLATAARGATAPEVSATVPASGAAIVNPPVAVHDFTLTNQDGTPQSIQSLRGKAVLLFFGYTHCPDECPITMGNFKLVQQALDADARKVAFVFVSVDGARDTPPVMKAYIDHYSTDFIGLTADDATLRRMAADYGALYKIPDQPSVDSTASAEGTPELVSDNYFVEHTSPAYLIDPSGKLRMVFFYGTSPKAITDGIRQILAERG